MILTPLTTKQFTQKINSFATTDFNENDAKKILDRAKQDDLYYSYDEKNNLIVHDSKVLKYQECNYSDIIHNFILSYYQRDLNKLNPNERESINKEIDRYSKINAKLRIGQELFYYGLKSENEILRKKLEENLFSTDTKEEEKGIWNELSTKKKAAVISEINAKYVILKPSDLIQHFEKHPSTVENFLDKETFEKIQNLSEVRNPIEFLYNSIWDAYKEQLEPSKYRIERTTLNGEIINNYGNNKNECIDFMNKISKRINDVAISTLYTNDSSNIKLYEKSENHSYNYETKEYIGLLNKSDLVNYYNQTKKGSEKLTENTASVILNYLNKNEKNIYLHKYQNKENKTNFDFIYEEKFLFKRKITLEEIFDIVKKDAEKETKKTIEKNHYKHLKGNGVYFANEGTLESSSIVNLIEKISENYSKSTNKEYEELDQKIKKLESEKNRLSINNTSHLNELMDITENKLSISTIKRIAQINYVFEKSNLTESQVNKILDSTEDMARKFISINNNKRKR